MSTKPDNCTLMFKWKKQQQTKT